MKSSYLRIDDNWESGSPVTCYWSDNRYPLDRLLVVKVENDFCSKIFYRSRKNPAIFQRNSNIEIWVYMNPDNLEVPKVEYFPFSHHKTGQKNTKSRRWIVTTALIKSIDDIF